MESKIITLEQPVETLCVEATDMQAGIKKAFIELEGKTGDLRGKVFYGAVICEGNRLVYRACVKKETGMHLPGTGSFILPAGKYARMVMKDWQSRIPLIKEMFMQMEKEYTPDHSRPQIEHYKSASELILLQPVM